MGQRIRNIPDAAKVLDYDTFSEIAVRRAQTDSGPQALSAVISAQQFATPRHLTIDIRFDF